MWLFAVAVILLMGGIGVVAAGRGGALAEEYDDRRDVRIPAEGRLSAADVRGVRFNTVFRGYRAAEVDALLARLADEIDARSPHPSDHGGDPAPGEVTGDGGPADEGAGTRAQRPS